MLTKAFAIKSSCSSRLIKFSPIQYEGFKVELTDPYVSCQADIFPVTDEDGLTDFFTELGSSTTPWQGQRSWSSICGDFCISAGCSSLGVVVLDVTIRGQMGGPDNWSVSARIETELGLVLRILA